MLDQSFSTKNLLKLIKSEDLIRLKKKIDISNLDESVKKVSSIICDKDYDFNEFDEHQTNHGTIFIPKLVQDEFALKKLNDNIIRLYKFKQADRFLIVKQISSLLNEEIPYAIIKIDIKKFYESIDRNSIKNKLINDPLLSYKSKQLLTKFFEIPQFVKSPGVPRGINLSASLSELYMRDFDRKIRQLDGIYYYSRYVDDIIIFTYQEPFSIFDKVKRILDSETSLKLNNEKTILLERVKCRCKPKCKCIGTCKCLSSCKCKDFHNLLKFEYLGYKFIFPDLANDKTKLEITLAKSKINKIKTRIVKALLDYTKENDFELLKKRLLFLTGNFRLKRRNNKSLNAGIFYNYQNINNFTDLNNLTQFLRKAINSKSNSFGEKITRNFSKDQIKEIAKFNFESGFKNRRLKSFMPEEINKIKKCWLNE